MLTALVGSEFKLAHYLFVYHSVPCAESEREESTIALGARLLLLKMNHQPPIQKPQLIHRDEIFTKRFAKSILRDVLIDGIPPPQQLPELLIRRRNPFDNQMPRRQSTRQRSNPAQRNLAPQQQMVNHRQHHHRVEMPRTPAQKRRILPILPTCSRRWMRQVDAQRKNLLPTPLQTRKEPIHRLQI